MIFRGLFAGVACCGVFVTAFSCTSTKTTNTARTAREQLLVSNAIDHALEKVDLSTVGGANLFIEEKYLEGVDKAYLVGSLRHRAMLAGANIVAKAEEADIVLELRSGSIGTDSADSFVGSPEITLPGMLTLPEVRLISRSRQTATAKLGLVAYDPKSKQLLGQGGVSSAQSDDNNVFVFGVGPYHYGTVKEEVERTATPPVNTAQQLPSQVAFHGAKPIGSAVAKDDAPAGEFQLTGDEQPAK